MTRTADSKRYSDRSGPTAAARLPALAPALWMVFSLSLAACEKAGSGTTADSRLAEVPGTENRATRSAPETTAPIPARGNVTFFVGSTRFRAPRDVVGFQVGSDGDRVNFVTLSVYPPDLLPLSEATDKRNVNNVLITLEVDDGKESFSLPRDKEEAITQIQRKFSNQGISESEDEDLGLRRIVFDGRKNYTAYRRLDERRRPGDGRIPYVVCTGSPLSNGWPCTSYGEVPPNIRLDYQFYENNIADWASIDAGVFELIESYRVADE